MNGCHVVARRVVGRRRPSGRALRVRDLSLGTDRRAGLAATAGQIHPAVRRRQRHRRGRPADVRQARGALGQAGGDREQARRRRAGRDRRVRVRQRRPRAALCLERLVQRASLHAREAALRARARSGADRAGDRHDPHRQHSGDAEAHDARRVRGVGARRAEHAQCGRRGGRSGVHARLFPQGPQPRGDQGAVPRHRAGGDAPRRRADPVPAVVGRDRAGAERGRQGPDPGGDQPRARRRSPATSRPSTRPVSRRSPWKRPPASMARAACRASCASAFRRT